MGFPTNVTTVKITGRLLVSSVDGHRPTTERVAVPAKLQVEFTPEVIKVPAPGAQAGPTTFYRPDGDLPDMVRGVIDAEGYLCTPDPNNPVYPMFRGVRLMATDDDAISVKDWTWRVTVKTVAGKLVESYSIAVPKAAAVNGLDLTNLAPVPSTPGYGLPHAEAAAAAAAQDAQAAADAADRAEAQIGATVTEGEVVGDDLILRRSNGETINAGDVRGPQGLPGPNAIPADEAVAEYIGTDATNTQTAGDARWVTNEGADNTVAQALSEEGSASAASVEVISERVTQEKIEAHPLDQFKRAYFKSIKHVLPFRFPGFSSASSLWASGGYLYPQAFQVDHVARELFVVYAGMGYQAIAVWDWDTEVFKSCFGVVSNYVSEGAEILYEGGQRFLYLRTLVNSLQKFNVTSLPANLTTLSATSTIATEQGVNFTYRGGLWTVTDPTAIKGAYSSRGYFKTLDESFSPIGLVNFGELSVGGNPYKYQGNTVPKMQGICDAGGYYAVNMGGFQGRTASVSPYGLQGVRVFTSSGQLLVDSLIDPHAMMDILESEGLNPTRVEGEGIQVVDGKLVSLLLTSSYGPGISDTEGLVFLEEFSDKPDAIDFTTAASSWATPDIDSLQVGGFPRTIDGKLYDPISGEILDSVAKIVEYMKSVNQTFFSFYSSSVSVADVNSTTLPTGMWVTITNTNNATFFMTWTGGRHMTWQVYNSGGALVKAQIHPVVLGDDGTTYYRIRVNASGQVAAVAI